MNFDSILGIDCLLPNYVVVDCGEKKVTFRISEKEELCFSKFALDTREEYLTRYIGSEGVEKFEKGLLMWMWGKTIQS